MSLHRLLPASLCVAMALLSVTRTRGQSTSPAPPDTTEAKAPEGPKFTASSNSPFNLRWDHGLFAESADGAYRFHPTGRLDFDSAWYNASSKFQQSLDTPLLDGTTVRRFRLGFDGMIQRDFEFKLEADFSRASEFKASDTDPQSTTFLTDAWVALNDVPYLGTVRFGHQKENLSFIGATSSRFLPFMERPAAFDAFENDFILSSGVSFTQSYLDRRVTTWTGLFWNNTRTHTFAVGDGYAASGRVTWMPWYDEAQQQWLCLGVAGSLRSLSPLSSSVTIRPLVRAGQSSQVPDLIDTGSLSGEEGLRVGGLGAHGAWGPLTIGVEVQTRRIPNAFAPASDPGDPNVPLGNLFFSGYYVEALYFLTPGDHRPVNQDTPGYDRIVPVRSLLMSKEDCSERGWGAWEIGVRFDHVEVNSAAIQAGRLNAVTVALNWYLNGNAAVMVDYVLTHREMQNPDASGQFHGLGLRFRVDF